MLQTHIQHTYSASVSIRGL